jgi:hypothetical protein
MLYGKLGHHQIIRNLTDFLHNLKSFKSTDCNKQLKGSSYTQSR